ncbi:MAG: FKBP-type peptidyl-prolyl cis-trans isomerase [Clostridia bacterium]|nr:FKBP-type peptidyl-prolyl cis-trans isomerase [Clostridia bacterium]
MNVWKRLLAAALLLAVAASLLASCGKDKNKTEETTAVSTDGDATGDFDLVSTADPTFDYYRADLSAYLTLAESDFDGVRVALDLGENDVDDYLNDFLLPSYRTPNMTTDQAVKDGDKIYLWYTGYVDDFPFDGGNNRDDGEPHALKIGESDLPFPGFDAALIGNVPADTSSESPLTVNVTIPADYEDERIAGKEARFEVVIEGIVDGDGTVTDRAVLDGDTVKIRYVGYVDDYAFSGGSNMAGEDPDELVIGSGSFVGTFEEQLIGVIPQDTSKDSLHTITVTFPAEYRNTDLAGKETRFDVAIAGVFDGTYTIPELTEDFIKNKLQFETEETDVIAAYRADVLKQMRESAVADLESHKITRTLKTLRDSVAFGETLPAGETELYEGRWLDMIEYYYEYYNYMAAIYGGGPYFEDLDDAGRLFFGLGADADWRVFMHEQAEDMVKDNLILNSVARLYGVVISEEDAKEWVREQAESNEVDAAAVLDHFSLEEVYSSCAVEKARRILLSLAVYEYGELPIENVTAN